MNNPGTTEYWLAERDRLIIAVKTLTTERDGLLQQLQTEKDHTAFYRNACSRMNGDIEQILGKALGFPRFADDPVNFPEAVAEGNDQVCVGDHTSGSLAMMAADRIRDLTAEVERLRTGGNAS